MVLVTVWSVHHFSCFHRSPKRCCMAVTVQSIPCHHPAAAPCTACRAPCLPPLSAPCPPLPPGWRMVGGTHEAVQGWWVRATPRYHGKACQGWGDPAVSAPAAVSSWRGEMWSLVRDLQVFGWSMINDDYYKIIIKCTMNVFSWQKERTDTGSVTFICIT